MTEIPQAAIDAAKEALIGRYGVPDEQLDNEWLDRDVNDALTAAAPHIATAERKRVVDLMCRGFEALDPQTRALLAALMARWASAMTDDPAVLAYAARLLDLTERTTT